MKTKTVDHVQIKPAVELNCPRPTRVAVTRKLEVRGQLGTPGMDVSCGGGRQVAARNATQHLAREPRLPTHCHILQRADHSFPLISFYISTQGKC